MRKLTGETIVGVESERPLGWQRATYFKTERTVIPGGEWIVLNGNTITFHLISDENMIVQRVLKAEYQSLLVVLLSSMFFLIWILGLALKYSRHN